MQNVGIANDLGLFVESIGQHVSDKITLYLYSLRTDPKEQTLLQFITFYEKRRHHFVTEI